MQFHFRSLLLLDHVLFYLFLLKLIFRSLYLVIIIYKVLGGLETSIFLFLLTHLWWVILCKFDFFKFRLMLAPLRPGDPSGFCGVSS